MSSTITQCRGRRQRGEAGYPVNRELAQCRSQPGSTSKGSAGKLGPEPGGWSAIGRSLLSGDARSIGGTVAMSVNLPSWMMMKRFHIETTLSAADCQIAASSPVAFGIHVGIGALEFPSTDWRDFGVVILGWWATALKALDTGQTDVATLRFMDGPYEMQVTGVSGGHWQITARSRGRNSTILAESVVKPALMLAEVARVSESVLKAADDYGCWNDDCEKLAAIIMENSRRKGDAPLAGN